MELKLINDQGQSAATIAASDDLFARDYNEALIHQLVTAYQANGRSGTRAQKARGEINRSHKKPWRQKGTGRARAGFSGSPLWRGGGKIFPASPEENFTQKINRKMFRAGMAAILSQLVREGRLAVIDKLAVESPKTKAFVQKLKGLGLAQGQDSLLVITDEINDNLLLSTRNLPNVMVLQSRQVDPVSLVRFGNVLFTRAAVTQIEEMWT